MTDHTSRQAELVAVILAGLLPGLFLFFLTGSDLLFAMGYVVGVIIGQVIDGIHKAAAEDRLRNARAEAEARAEARRGQSIFVGRSDADRGTGRPPR